MVIIVGTIAALLSAAVYPLMFLMYGKVAGTLVDYNKNKTAATINYNLTNLTNSW